MRRAVIYARYSSDKQTDASIDAQVRACTDYAKQHNFRLVGEYADEAVSGKQSKTKKREHYQRLRKDMKKGMFDVILIHKYDRIARSVYEHVALAQSLTENGVELIAAAQDYGDGKEAKIVKMLQWAISEYYIENLAEETRKGLREVALDARHTGGYPPFGYDVIKKSKQNEVENGGLYVINEQEAEYVKRIFHAAASRAGFTEILREMQARDIRGKRGKPFAYNAIHAILKNEKYTGTYIYSTVQAKGRADRRTKATADIRIEGAIPQIIDKMLFDEVQKVMAERQQTGLKINYLCGGLVYCHCGAKMHPHNAKNGESSYPKWRCSKKGDCQTKYHYLGKEAKGVPIELVDNTAKRYLHDLLSDENQKLIAEAIKDYQRDANGSESDFKESIKQEIEAKRREYDAMVSNLKKETLPSIVLIKLGEDMARLLEEIEYLKALPPPVDFTADRVMEWLDNIKKAPDHEAIRLLIERIDLIPIKGGIEVKIKSTLNTVLGLDEDKKIPTTDKTSIVGKTGCGGRI